MENLKRYIATLTRFSESDWNILQECMSIKELKRNEPLLQEGQVCDAVFFISTGLCRACHNKDGKEVNTAFYFENDFATNLKSLTTASKSEYQIRSCEKTRAVRLDKNRLLEAYSRSHQVEAFGRKVLELIMLRQEELSDSFRLLTPGERFEKLVVEYPDFLQRVSLTQAASYLGTSRETLSRFRAARRIL